MVDRLDSRVDNVDRADWVTRAGRPRLDVVSYAAAILDAAIIILVSVLCAFAYSGFEPGHGTELSRHLGAGVLLAATFVTLLFAKGAYGPTDLVRLRKQMLRIAVYGSAAIGFLSLVAFLLKIGDHFSRGTMLLFVILCPLLLIVSRVFWSRWIPLATARGVLHPRRLLVICSQQYPIAQLREQVIESGMSISHVMALPPEGATRQWAGTISASVARSIDEVVVACENTELQKISGLLDELRMLPMPVKVTLDPMIADVLSHPMTRLGRLPAIEVQHAPLSWFQNAVKRGFDVAFALSAMVILLPIFIFTALAIKIDSPGPVFFVQRRRGWNDETFRVVKFRSMTCLEDGDHVAQATRNDIRVTRIGAIIRSTSIDELPQLWNVLRGQMSVIGPRPHAVVHDDRYDELISRYAYRRRVKPGITGWAQINGLRGETPTLESMEARVAHDLWYIHNWSLWLDVKIVLLTVVALNDRTRSY